MHRAYQLYDRPWTHSLLPAPNPVQRFAEDGSNKWYRARDYADVLLDLAPDLQIRGILALVDPVGKPEDHDAEAGGGTDDGAEADGEDAD